MPNFQSSSVEEYGFDTAIGTFSHCGCQAQSGSHIYCIYIALFYYEHSKQFTMYVSHLPICTLVAEAAMQDANLPPRAT